MMEIKQKDRLLFMKHAIPCAGALVERGSVSKAHINELTEIVKNGGKVPKNAEKTFKVAFAACSLIAINSGKRSIDEKTIHEYYRFQHDAMINKRYEQMRDFDTKLCRIRPGVVVSAGKRRAVVENSLGKRRYRADFAPTLKKGDLVTTHWDFVIEKIDRKTFDRMKKQKEKLRIK